MINGANIYVKWREAIQFRFLFFLGRVAVGALPLLFRPLLEPCFVSAAFNGNEYK